MKSQTHAHGSVLELLRCAGHLLTGYRNVLALVALVGGLAGCRDATAPDGDGSGTISRPPKDTIVVRSHVEYEGEDSDSLVKHIVKPALIDKR